MGEESYGLPSIVCIADVLMNVCVCVSVMHCGVGLGCTCGAPCRVIIVTLDDQKKGIKIGGTISFLFVFLSFILLEPCFTDPPNSPWAFHLSRPFWSLTCLGPNTFTHRLVHLLQPSSIGRLYKIALSALPASLVYHSLVHYVLGWLNDSAFVGVYLFFFFLRSPTTTIDLMYSSMI